ncbi:hypothetical protein SLEP1_g11422 [Rubroshorea leprosula]|uniref:Uncharacterized protein n=1 Tax=Rubroshorea leprosula TaxID=152421 RepID=A0AAV5IKH4_9ROSI|nr:hypothetical protein SLEP1_g11422 [Rubroshorea leprosula]
MGRKISLCSCRIWLQKKREAESAVAAGGAGSSSRGRRQ